MKRLQYRSHQRDLHHKQDGENTEQPHSWAVWEPTAAETNKDQSKSSRRLLFGARF